jgi:hypothetical protein
MWRFWRSVNDEKSSKFHFLPPRIFSDFSSPSIYFSCVEIYSWDFPKNGKTVDEWGRLAVTWSPRVTPQLAAVGGVSCRSPQSPRQRRARAVKPPVFIGPSPRPPSSSPECRRLPSWSRRAPSFLRLLSQQLTPLVPFPQVTRASTTSESVVCRQQPSPPLTLLSSRLQRQSAASWCRCSG